MRELKPMFQELLETPWVAAALIAISNGSMYLVQNFDMVLARFTHIASFILVIVSIRYYLKSTRKIDRRLDDERR